MSPVEWWGSEAENKSQRRVFVRVGTTVVSSSDQVRWARHVLSGMVFGLSRGHAGSSIPEPSLPPWPCECQPDEPEVHNDECPAWCHARTVV